LAEQKVSAGWPTIREMLNGQKEDRIIIMDRRETVKNGSGEGCSKNKASSVFSLMHRYTFTLWA
jgi:hypothetical protein